MPEPLTPLERRVYHYLLDFLAENTYQPSIREIGEEVSHQVDENGLRPAAVARADKGYIERDPVALARRAPPRLLGRGEHAARSVLREDRTPASRRCSPEHREGYITMDRRFLPSEDVFFLQSQGRQHDRARHLRRRLRDGESPSARAKDGDIVAARLGEEATVKTLTHRGATIVLEPANEAEREIEVGPRTTSRCSAWCAGSSALLWKRRSSRR